MALGGLERAKPTTIDLDVDGPLSGAKVALAVVLGSHGAIDLRGIEVTVLDEADHMADLGFLPGVTRILDATPAGGQRLLFSATLDNGVDKIVRRFLNDPVTHSVDDVDSHVSAMTHHVYELSSTESKTGSSPCYGKEA